MELIPYWFQITLVFIIGACIGSFLNVCIYRLPREKSIIRPGSSCTHCQHEIPWHCNVPLLSYIVLKGKCQFCSAKIPFRYFSVELLTASLLLLLYIVSSQTPSPLLYFFFFSIFICGLIVATFIDLEFYIIPDSVSCGGIPIGIVACTFLPFLMNQTSPLWGAGFSLFSALFGGSLLLTIAFVGKLILKRDVMGMGDIKLMAMIGAFLGLQKVCLTLFLGSIVGSIISVILMSKQKAGWKTQIPFGPYLAIGALMALFFGDLLWDWYFGFYETSAHHH